MIDKEFILRDFKDKKSDLVYEANINGNEIIFYVLLELQSSVDSSITILKLLKENKNISEISKITGVKEDKIK